MAKYAGDTQVIKEYKRELKAFKERVRYYTKHGYIVPENIIPKTGKNITQKDVDKLHSRQGEYIKKHSKLSERLKKERREKKKKAQEPKPKRTKKKKPVEPIDIDGYKVDPETGEILEEPSEIVDGEPYEEIYYDEDEDYPVYSDIAVDNLVQDILDRCSEVIDAPVSMWGSVWRAENAKGNAEMVYNTVMQQIERYGSKEEYYKQVIKGNEAEIIDAVEKGITNYQSIGGMDTVRGITLLTGNPLDMQTAMEIGDAMYGDEDFE